MRNDLQLDIKNSCVQSSTSNLDTLECPTVCKGEGLRLVGEGEKIEKGMMIATCSFPGMPAVIVCSNRGGEDVKVWVEDADGGTTGS